ncbi:MAG: SMP-30/gluconolactonase/LRE family protein [Inquilinus sp.]|nr:SMP-30/gluconolactonase/LRE family protein [Inquilinus sp.]
MDSPVRCVQAANAILGEGPVWCPREGVLYWLDIKRPAVYRFDPGRGQTGCWPMPSDIGCMALREAGGMVVALRSGFALLDFDTGELTPLADPEADRPDNRFNDGKVDRRGRFWAGTLNDAESDPLGSLYRLDADGSVPLMQEGAVVSNGIGWSPDDRTMYFTDSAIRTIWAYDFDAVSGAIANRRVFAEVPEGTGYPDGLTVDADGHVWSAVWDGWRVVRYDPSGRIDREVAMPVQRPTSCMLGGDDLKTLFVTSASIHLDAVALSKGPLAGGLFALDVDTAGLPESRFAG